MQLTKSTLKQIIKEEMQDVLNEGPPQCKMPGGTYKALFQHIQQYCKWRLRGTSRTWYSHWFHGREHAEQGCPGKHDIQAMAYAYCTAISYWWQKQFRNFNVTKDKYGNVYCDLDDSSCKNLAQLAAKSQKMLNKTERNPRWALKYLRTFGPEVLMPGRSPCGEGVPYMGKTLAAQKGIKLP